jgi:hypothetical protein
MSDYLKTLENKTSVDRNKISSLIDFWRTDPRIAILRRLTNLDEVVSIIGTFVTFGDTYIVEIRYKVFSIECFLERVQWKEISAWSPNIKEFSTRLSWKSASVDGCNCTTKSIVYRISILYPYSMEIYNYYA